MGENLSKLLILSVVGFIVIYAFMQKPGSFTRSRPQPVHSEEEAIPKNSEEPQIPTPVPTAPPRGAALINQSRMVPKVAVKNNKPPANALKYRLEDGVAVVQGDIVIGEIVTEEGAEAPDSGYVAMPSLKLWRSPVIPYYIQPSLRDPERVLHALEMFSNTVIQFVPFNGQEDVMVFEEANGECKSYVGRIGGKQPLWISPGCQPDDIAHEILHALGFVHEQNRTDRDQYLHMLPDNIDERYKDNFYRLPQELMKVSGLGAFDYESLMIYPPDMFSKNGQATMQSKVKEKEIKPGRSLSPGDVERVNKAYGGL